MVTSSGLRHNQFVTDPLAVTVYDINGHPTPPRDVELIATDVAGVELQVVTWKKHDVTVEWDIDTGECSLHLGCDGAIQRGSGQTVAVGMSRLCEPLQCVFDSPRTESEINSDPSLLRTALVAQSQARGPIRTDRLPTM